MPDQVVDQHRASADPQRLLHEEPQTLRVKVMGKQVAANQVECVLVERQGQPVANDRAPAIKQVSPRPIQQSDIQRDPRARDHLSHDPRNSS